MTRFFRPCNDARFHQRPPIKERRARGFERAIPSARHAGMTLVDPVLKRAPRGYATDHPRVDRLRLKNITVFARHALEPWLHEERCRELIRSELDGARPLVTWLAENVGPPGARPGDG